LSSAPLGAAPESGRQFQSSGGSAIPHTLPWLYNDTPIKKLFPSLPKGRQFATRPDTLPPPGSSLRSTGVSIGKACDARIPQPCGLTITATHCAENECLRSMLVTTREICTRNRVLRRTVLGVSISILPTMNRQHTSVTERGMDARYRIIAFM
jgi:hypothetical protein